MTDMSHEQSDSYRDTLARLVIGWLLHELADGVAVGHMLTAHDVHSWLVRYDRHDALRRFNQWFHETDGR